MTSDKAPTATRVDLHCRSTASAVSKRPKRACVDGPGTRSHQASKQQSCNPFELFRFAGPAKGVGGRAGSPAT